MGWNDHSNYLVSESFSARHFVDSGGDWSERQKTAASISGRIIWLSPTTGATACPLGHPCRVHVDDKPAPLYYCLHENCREELRDWTSQLRRRCASLGKPRALTKEEMKLKRQAEQDAAMLRTVEAMTRRYTLPELLGKPEVPPDQWRAESPHPLPEDRSVEWKMLVTGLYKSGDRLWMGDLEFSGNDFFSVCFKEVADWVETRRHPGTHICPGIFFQYDAGMNQISQRSKELVRLRPYLIAESDTLSVGQFGTVVRHLQDRMTLRALVTTGRRSVHAWFDHPVSYDLHRTRLTPAQDYTLKELKAYLVGLGCDPHMFNVNSTTRLPGCDRYDDDSGEIIGEQRLVYFNPKHEPQLKEFSL